MRSARSIYLLRKPPDIAWWDTSYGWLRTIKAYSDHTRPVNRIKAGDDDTPVADLSLDDVEYRNLRGQLADGDLREKLQTVYTKWTPIYIAADGLNVMDDVGGLSGYESFLHTINSKDLSDQEEKAEWKEWAKNLGWTGRRIKPENML